jgi:hypothetical protein
MINNLTQEQSDLSKRIHNLVLGRVFKKVNDELSEADKKVMEDVFDSKDDKAKEKYIKKNIPNFEDIFKEELIKVSGEILEVLKNKK